MSGLHTGMLHSQPFERAISVLVIMLIIWLGLTTDLIVMVPWLEETDYTIARSLIFSVFNVLWAMALWSMIGAGWTEPGEIPPGYKPPEAAVGQSGGWCRKCNRHRPPRAHHCKGCGKCRLKMDHHCPWIGNCVGYWNHGDFLRFLTYAAAGLLFAFFANLLHLMFRLPLMMYEDLSQLQIIITVINGAFSFCLLVMVGILLIYQWSNCLENMTTIEHLEWDAAVSKARRIGKGPVVFPWNLGSAKENLRTLLGHRLWAWPLPLPASYLLQGQGDGLVFPAATSEPWPPIWDSEDWLQRQEDERLRSQSDPALHRTRRERFRRGSEGYMIPVDEIGVQYNEDDDILLAAQGRLYRQPDSSAPLLSITTHGSN